MRVVVLLVCLVPFVASQTTNLNNNPTGELGSPAFDEIVVHSTLNVRGKSGSRGAKALVSDSKGKTTTTTTQKPEFIPLLNGTGSEAGIGMLKRVKRVPRRYYGTVGAPVHQFGFPGSSSSSAHASSNAFQQNTPFGSFGGGASQTATQSQSFGPHGFQASAGQSASQTYRLPNGNQIDVAFSGGYSAGNKAGPSFSNSHSVTVTRPNGQKYQLSGRR